MSNLTDFPTPTMISLNGVELEVFEAGRENMATQLYFAMVGQNMLFRGATKCLFSQKRAITSSFQTSGDTASHLVH